MVITACLNRILPVSSSYFHSFFVETSILDAGAVVEILIKSVSPCSSLHVTTTVVAVCCTSDSTLWAACQCVRVT
jgi:hypothetical protein